MPTSKKERYLVEDPVGFFEDRWENAKRIARQVADSDLVQAMQANPRATMQALGESAWETAKETPGNIYRYAQEKPQELWGHAAEAGATAALGMPNMVRYAAFQPVAANVGEDQLTADIQNRMEELGKKSLAEVKPGELAGDYAHGGVVEHALRMLRHHYATDGTVTPLTEEEKKKQQALEIARQLNLADSGGGTLPGAPIASNADMAAAINANAARGDNSLFGDKDNAGRSGVVGGILDAAKGAGSSIVDSVKGAGNAIVDTAKGAGNALVDTAKSGFNTVANAFTPAPQYVDMPLPPEKPADLNQIPVPLPPERTSEKEFNAPPAPAPASAPVAAAPAPAPAPQATRGVTIAEEEVPATPAPAPVAAPATPATAEQIQNANSMMFGSPAGVNQSFQNQAPTLSLQGFQPYSDIMAPYSNMPGVQGAAPNVGGMPGSVSGYPGMAQQQEQISGLNQMPMSTNVVPEATIGSQAYGPTLNQTQAEILGFDRVSDADKFAAWQNEADRVANLGFENNPITGQTDISNPGAPSVSYDPALAGVSPDSVSYGGLTPGGASAAINEAVTAGDTTMFGGNNTADYGPAGGVEVEGNAPEGTGQEGAPEGDGGGTPEGGGGPEEKRGGKVSVKRNDTFVNHALKVSSKFGSDAAKRSVKKAKAARWTHR